MRGLIATILTLLLASQAPAGSLPELFAPDPSTYRISVRVLPGLGSMADLPDLALRNARERLLRGGSVPDVALRQLADLGDGLAAQRYVRRLQARAGARPSDIAYYAAIAAGTGNIWSLSDMIEAMHRIPPGSESQGRIRTYIRVLYAHAWAGNQLALDAVLAFNGEGRLFGPLSEATHARLLEQAQSGDGRIALRLAARLLEDRPLDARRTHLAAAYLDHAATSDHPGIAAAALTMRRMLALPGDPGG